MPQCTCSRGTLLGTIPFDSTSGLSVKRAEINDNKVTHFLPVQYHGNPLSSKGSLVFSDEKAGFASAGRELYSEPDYGHLGPGLLVFRADKASSVELNVQPFAMQSWSHRYAAPSVI